MTLTDRIGCSYLQTAHSKANPFYRHVIRQRRTNSEISFRRSTHAQTAGNGCDAIWLRRHCDVIAANNATRQTTLPTGKCQRCNLDCNRPANTRKLAASQKGRGTLFITCMQCTVSAFGSRIRWHFGVARHVATPGQSSSQKETNVIKINHSQVSIRRSATPWSSDYRLYFSVISETAPLICVHILRTNNIFSKGTFRHTYRRTLYSV